MQSGTHKLLEDIRAELRYTRSMIGRDTFDERVMMAMEEVPRHHFVPDHEQGYAYANGPLPIGHGQTISQPFIVALMTDLLACGPDDCVLEVGTGSGYQAAILSRVVGQVRSVEIIPELARQSAARLARLGYTNIETRHSDGYTGWPESVPYDGILVTAAAPAVPPPLIEQLKEGHRLVIPVGPQYGHQELVVIEKRQDGSLSKTAVLGVVFVPLTRMPSDSQGERT
ncbi:protein-L-isoaspartate(D-aspartate) O-methyltransferase [Candidatus Thiosymbion oneisti]|uniref:protein-L-isoaspartate(D-aspartate) O-methyltransferase n=1 Tax=Candidatus Thiosymbion oneisti TaxID=589554 RepID=UPI000AFCC2B5|nr:protein-L-isoaspartate(D-aspartate) O-methyltransferase [Candidatus Thiosymbion oneisti]